MTGSVRFARCTVDLVRGWLHPLGGGPDVRLSTRERELLAYLAARSPDAVSREELHREVWGHHAAVLSRTCDTTVHRLRLKIEDDPGNPRHLLTAHGNGYQLVHLDVASTPAPAPRTADLVLGVVRIDLDARRYEDGARDGPLTAAEAQLLHHLARASGRVVGRRELVRRGIGGSPEGRRLGSVLARLRAKVDPEARYLVTEVGDGLRLVVDARPAATPATRFGPPADVARVLDALASYRLVTLFGPDGIGKTRLARAVVAAGGWRSVWVEAGEDLAAAAALALALPPASGPLGARVTAALAARERLLLVLDGADPRSVGAVASWLQGAAELRVLATARTRLRTRGERAIEVPPLALDDAVALFLDRARGAADRREVEARVSDLGGLPLAIELAAARYARDPTPGHARSDASGLRGALRASFAALPAPARRNLARLAVVEGSFSLDAAEAIGGEPDLDDLVDLGLVRIDADGRWRLPSAVRAFAADDLDPAKRAAAEERHGRFYAAPGPAVRGPDELDVRRALLQDLPNLRRAAERALARGDAALAVGALRRIEAAGGSTEADARDAENLARTAADPATAARAAVTAMQALTRTGQVDRAAALLPVARGLEAQPLGPDLLELLEAEAALYRGLGQTALVAATSERLEALATELRLVIPRCFALAGLAEGHARRGDLQGARELLVQAEQLAEHHAGPSVRADLLRRRAEVEANAGRFARVIELLDRADALVPAPPAAASLRATALDRLARV